MGLESFRAASFSSIPFVVLVLVASAASAQGIPSHIKETVSGIKGAVGLRVVKEPEDMTGLTYVARIDFEPARRGYKACPDHYPARHIPVNEACPDRLQNDRPASGWINCHNAFYTPESYGCPPQPEPAKIPSTLPPPRCNLGAEACKTDIPGGPILIRAMKVSEGVSQELAIDRTAPIAATPQVAVKPQSVNPNIANVAVKPDGEIRARIPAESLNLDLTRLRLVNDLQLQEHLSCIGDNCQWGATDEPLTLPAPPIVPRRHVPCDYEFVSFFVFENRYCPREDLGEQPVAGAALFVEWSPENPGVAKMYYHRDDFDGVIRVAYRILGVSDDRFGLADATDRERLAAASTAMLIENDLVSDVDSNGNLQIADFPSWPKLCSDERFAGLPQPGRCSGVKVGDSLVATSAHCMRSQRDCDRSSVVFGYAGGNDAGGERTVEQQDIYHCKAIIAQRLPATFGERGADWAIFAVDREIDAPTAALADSRNVEPSLVTTVIGHPIGLPSIVTRYGVVQTKTSQYFIANSDTFVGNSGSAVYSAQSIEDRRPIVLGLLTGGARDFDEHEEDGEHCVRSQWCSDPSCLGDDVVYADDLIKVLSEVAGGT